MDRLEGRVAVITGGASGIGRALVLELAAAGMSTVVADIEVDRAENVAAEARALDAAALAVETDVADSGSVEELAAVSFERFGEVHVLCNNAGVLLFKGFADSATNDWKWVYGVNVMGVIHGVAAFLPRMLSQDTAGHIVNTSSIAALGATGIYGTSKATVLTLTDALADELEGAQIGVSALLPGMVDTRILTAERNRPVELGGPAQPTADDASGGFGVDPAHCATRLREALLTGERYVFAGIPPDTFDLETQASGRFAALMASIDAGLVTNENQEDAL